MTEVLEEGLAAAGDGADPLSILFIDLDGFKAVNDSHGHAAGDLVLKEVAARLLDAVRPRDAVGRYGGDEFLIIASGLSSEPAAQALVAGMLQGLGQRDSDQNQVAAGRRLESLLAQARSRGVQIGRQQASNPDNANLAPPNASTSAP